MSYRELGEARILKRYSKQDYMEPARADVVQGGVKRGTWQSLEDATALFLKNVKQPVTLTR